MKLCSIDQASLGQLLECKLHKSEILWSRFEQPLHDCPAITETVLSDLNSYCLEQLRKSKGADAERAMIAKVHQALAIPPFVAADNGFWRWISVRFFFETVQARHGSPEELAKEANFGAKDRFESLIGRLWFRGDIAHEDGVDPYRLAERGDQDFWRSHVLRKRYSLDRNFVKSLIKFQYPAKDRTRLHPSKPGGMRTLTKRVQATHAAQIIELMDEMSLQNLLERLATDLEVAAREASA